MIELILEFKIEFRSFTVCACTKTYIKSMYRTKLIFSYIEETLVLTPDYVELSKTEIKKLNKELDCYNKHLQRIIKGIALNECYSDLRDKECYFMKRMRTEKDIPDSYKHIPRGYYIDSCYEPRFKAVVKDDCEWLSHVWSEEEFSLDRSDVVVDLSPKEITGIFLYRHGEEGEDGGFSMRHDILPITEKMLSKYCSEEDFKRGVNDNQETDKSYSDYEAANGVEKTKEIAFLQKLIEEYQEEKQRTYYRSIFPKCKIEDEKSFVQKKNEISKTLQEILKWKVTGER